MLAIRQFPTLENITDMRSYFALVNKVSPYYSVQQKLLAFREFFKKNARFYWDEVLQKLFEETREVIANKVVKGVYSFEVERWTGVLIDVRMG